MAGRPRKEKKEEVKSNETNQDMFAQMLEQALQKQQELFEKKLDEKLQEKEKELEEKYKADVVTEITETSDEVVRKFVPEDASIRIAQNIGGSFVISENKDGGYFKKFTSYNSSHNIKFKHLRNFHSRKTSFLENGNLKIISVKSSDPNITLEDVIYDLNLEDIYYDDKKISPLDVEYFLLKENDIAKFEKKVNNSKNMLGTIIEIALVLYKKGKFNDNAKMNVLRASVNKFDLFK